MLFLTFPSSNPTHLPSLWLYDEVCCGSSWKKWLQSLQVSCIQRILDEHVLAGGWWPSVAGAEWCSVCGLFPQQVAAEVMGGQLPFVLVPL